MAGSPKGKEPEVIEPKAPKSPGAKSPEPPKSPEAKSPEPPKSPEAKTPEPPKSPARVGEEVAVDSTFQPGSHWAAQGMPTADNTDADSSLGSDAASSTASLSSSIMEYRTVNGRTYHSDRGNTEYWGPNDEQGQDGIDIQNHVWSLAFNDRLHLAPLKDDISKVVDIGTGTGIWAIDFADSHPECHIIGTDLSPIQPSWIPPNLNFQIDDFNQEWTFQPNSLDYVHIRWLAGAVPNWNFLMQQAYRVLKPGGWVESWDLDAAFIADDGSVPPKSALAQWYHIFDQFSKTMAVPTQFFPVQSGVQTASIEAAGFVNIEKQAARFPVSPWAKDKNLKLLGQYQQAAIEVDLQGWIGYAAAALGWTQEEMTIYGAHLRKELRDMSRHAYVPALAVWAQKPEC